MGYSWIQTTAGASTRKAGSSGEPRTVEKDNHSKSWAQATGLRLQGSETSEYLERPSHVAIQHTETDLPRTARASSLRHGTEVRQGSTRNRSHPDIYDGRVPSFWKQRARTVTVYEEQNALRPTSIREEASANYYRETR